MPDVKLYNPHDGLSKCTYMGEDFALPPNKDTAIEVPEHMAKQGITSKILADHAVASVGVWGVVAEEVGVESFEVDAAVRVESALHDPGSGVDGLLQFLDVGGCGHDGVGELVGGGGALVGVHGDGDGGVAGHGLYLVGGDAAVDHDVYE